MKLVVGQRLWVRDRVFRSVIVDRVGAKWAYTGRWRISAYPINGWHCTQDAFNDRFYTDAQVLKDRRIDAIRPQIEEARRAIWQASPDTIRVVCGLLGIEVPPFASDADILAELERG